MVWLGDRIFQGIIPITVHNTINKNFLGLSSDFVIDAGGPVRQHIHCRYFALRYTTHFSSPVIIHAKNNSFVVPGKQRNKDRDSSVPLIRNKITCNSTIQLSDET